MAIYLIIKRLNTFIKKQSGNRLMIVPPDPIKRRMGDLETIYFHDFLRPQ